jgi:chaperonin cofactor prefoldin
MATGLSGRSTNVIALTKSEKVQNLKCEANRLEVEIEYHLTFEQKIERLEARIAYLKGELRIFQETH